MPAANVPQLLIVEAIGWSYNNQSEWCYGPDSDVDQGWGQCAIEYLCEEYGVDIEPSADGAVVEVTTTKDGAGEAVRFWQVYDVAAWVRAAKTLRGLAYRLRCAHEAGVEIDTDDLPTYGGEAPDLGGVYSWDQDEILVPDAEIRGGRETWGCVAR